MLTSPGKGRQVGAVILYCKVRRPGVSGGKRGDPIQEGGKAGVEGRRFEVGAQWPAGACLHPQRPIVILLKIPGTSFYDI